MIDRLPGTTICLFVLSVVPLIILSLSLFRLLFYVLIVCLTFYHISQFDFWVGNNGYLYIFHFIMEESEEGVSIRVGGDCKENLTGGCAVRESRKLVKPK